MTNKMVEHTSSLTEIKMCEKIPNVDISTAARYTIGDRIIDVFDCVEDHEAVLNKCFALTRSSA